MTGCLIDIMPCVDPPMQATFMDQKVKDTNNRIDKEVANLKTQMEAQKLESIKYLAGGIFSIVTIVLSVVLGMWRLMK